MQKPEVKATTVDVAPNNSLYYNVKYNTSVLPFSL